MFLDLINLYNRNTNRVPLEDFNTECLANILKLYEPVRVDFIYNFLNLPEDEYNIKTQFKKDLFDDQNCIIDLVFIGERNICFIENKIESKEGWEQLRRYRDVLNIYYTELKKYLFYCTKYTDLKNSKGELDNYNFRQFKWFEVCTFLRKYQKENPLIKEYIKFLNNYKMGQDNTLKSENFLAMENILKTIEISEFHIDNCKLEFDNLFGTKKKVRNFNWNQLKTHNRICNYSTGVLKSDNKGYSEVLYCIEFNSLKLRTQIYINSNHSKYKEFKSITFDKKIVKTYDFGDGFCCYVNIDLGVFLNDSNSDVKIKNWFVNSFDVMKNIFLNNPHLDFIHNNRIR